MTSSPMSLPSCLRSFAVVEIISPPAPVGIRPRFDTAIPSIVRSTRTDRPLPKISREFAILGGVTTDDVLDIGSGLGIDQRTLKGVIHDEEAFGNADPIIGALFRGDLDEAERLLDVAPVTSRTRALRADVLRKIAENQLLQQREFNRAFVLMQYFGYLRRNPNAAPEATLDFSGFNFWLNKLNSFNGDFVQAEMVKAFINSTEYRRRFGPEWKAQASVPALPKTLPMTSPRLAVVGVVWTTFDSFPRATAHSRILRSPSIRVTFAAFLQTD